VTWFSHRTRTSPQAVPLEAPLVTVGSDASLVTRTRRTIRLVRVLTPREIRVRYRQSYLDLGWALITPVSVAIVYGIVLTRSFNASGNGVPYLSMAWSGLVLWTFFANAIGGAATSLVYSSGLVTKVYFPREALPLAMAGASLPDLAIGLITVFVLVLVQGVTLHWEAVTAVLPLAILVIWTAALSVILGVVSSFVRDVPHLVQLIIRVGFFATPVMYDAAALPPALQWSAVVSPIAVSIEGFRDAVLHGRVPDLPLMTIHLLLGLALLVAAVCYTRAIESRIADVI